MKTTLDCVPCFLRQALDVARFVTDDAAVHERIVRDTLAAVSGMDFDRPPPVVGQQIHRRLREMTGRDDPYREAKDRFNRLALAMLPDLRRQVRSAGRPFLEALRLAIAGNVIDLGVHGAITEDEARAELEGAAARPLLGDVDRLEREAAGAQRILFLADNAGEIVFDRLLLEQLPVDRVTVAVRGGAVINDATLEDAQSAGLYEDFPVMDNGSDAPGTVLAECSPAFRRCFERADLVIAKGQGNYETLSEQAGRIFFLLRVKCPVIASRTGVDVGTHLVARSSG